MAALVRGGRTGLAALVAACALSRAAAGAPAAGTRAPRARSGGPTVVRAREHEAGSYWRVRLDGGLGLRASGGSHQPTRVRVGGSGWYVGYRDGDWHGWIGFHPRRPSTWCAGDYRWDPPQTTYICCYPGYDWRGDDCLRECEAAGSCSGSAFRSNVGQWTDSAGAEGRIGRRQGAPVTDDTASPLTASARLVILGHLAFRDGRFEEAAIRYGEAVLADRENGEATLGFGQALLALGRDAEAARALRQLVARHGQWVDLDLEVQQRGPDSDGMQAALSRLKACVAGHEGDRDARFLLGFAHAFVGDLETAVREMSVLAGYRLPDAEAGAVVAALRRRTAARTASRQGDERPTEAQAGQPDAAAPRTETTSSGGEP